MGGAATYCMSSRLEAGSLKLRCLNGENGRMRHSDIEFGLISKKAGNDEFCLNSAIEGFRE